MKLFVCKITLPVSDLKRAVEYYSRLFFQEGDKVNSEQHFFTLGDTLFTCVKVNEEFERAFFPFCIATDHLESLFTRARLLNNRGIDTAISENDLDEMYFNVTDPFGNKLQFISSKTIFYGLNP